MAAAQAPVPERIEPVAELREPFSEVRGIRELADGRVIVADFREKAVYVADFGKQTRTRVGRNGSGPEEYNAPVGLYPAPADSSWLLDIWNGRISVLDPTGRVARSEPIFGRNHSLPTAADTFGNLYWDDSARSRDRARILRWTRDEPPDTLAFLELPEQGPLRPFKAWDGWAVGRDGLLAVVHNRDSVLVEIVQRDGTVTRGPPTAYEPVRVNRADRDAYAAGNDNGGRVMGAAVIGTPGRLQKPRIAFPERFPPVRASEMWVAADGLTWIQRHQHLEDDRVYDVFDGSGTRIAAYRLPPATAVVGFGLRGMYALRTDDVGLQWLERFDVSAVAGRDR